MKEISVIIPAYNVGKYLGDCLETLLNQSFKDIEIIVVNDGSVDNTAEILSNYAQKYPDIITAVSQENQGQSVARNTAIALAKGKYLAFIDSDDRIKDNMLEILYNKAIESDCDVVACNVNCVYPDKTVVINSGIHCNSKALSVEEKKELFSMYPIVCNKLFKKELFTEKGLKFEPGIWFEDVLFVNMMIAKISSIAYVEDSLYDYIQRPNSVTYTYSDKLFDINKMLHKTMDFYRECGLFDEYKDELEYMYVRYMFATYIKRLSKSKDFSKFKQGINYAIDKVKSNFPEYKKNHYIVSGGLKSIYLKFFNPLLAYAIFLVEKNRMN